MLVFGIALGLISNSEVRAAAPTLTHLFPAGGQRGTRVTVTCGGTFKWPEKVWAPGVDAVPAAESGKIEVSIPADLAADRVWIRLYNDEGASALQPFLIGSLKELSEVEPNDRPNAAQQVAESVVMNGVLKDKDVDCFTVKLEAGQTLVAALDANTRLGSPMDAVIQVVTAEGIVLAENHDDLKLDPRLAFTAPKAGDYVVRLFAFPAAPDASIRFIGGNNYIYRLTMTTGPYVTHVVPLSAPLESPGAIGVTGWNTASDVRLNIVPWGAGKLADLMECEVLDELRRSPENRTGIAFSPDFALAGRVRLTNQSIVEAFEQTDPKQPITITASSSVTGCLKTRRQRDEYRIPLAKGQSVLISVEARGLDLPIDPVMKLLSPSGAVLAEVDDTGSTRDSLIAHTAAEDGEYRVQVRDRYGQGNPRCWYLLTVRNDQSDFQLSVATDAITVTSEKPFEFPVKIQRNGKTPEPVGPITIEAIGLPEGVKAPSVVSEGTGPTAAEVKLTLTTEGKGFSGPIRIVGRSKTPTELERAARTPARLGVSFEAIWLTAIGQ